MFFMFGKKSQVKLVKGGRVLRGRCPRCGEVAKLRECVKEETLTAYHFVDLIGDKETVFRCNECGELSKIDAKRVKARRRTAAQGKPTPSPEPSRDDAVDWEAELRKREHDKARNAAKADDELAALKRKMGL